MPREYQAMKILFLIVFLLSLVGCKGQTPTESEKQMLQCKHNLREYRQLVDAPLDSRRGEKRRPKVLPTGVPGCPAAGSNTYSESYNPKTGEIFCQGHHHKKAGLARDYPRLLPKSERDEPEDAEQARQLSFKRNFAPYVKENESGVTPLPTGFPLPLDVPVETLSVMVGRNDGTFRVYLRCVGDIAELEEKWREALDYQVHSPGVAAGQRFYLKGKTPLGNAIDAWTEQGQEGVVGVRYDPAFLVNDL